MIIQFYKYQATGNDFIIIDAFKQSFEENNYSLISHLCNRHFGIGADGLILFKKHPSYDFEMMYYNADGYPATMCGNGGRSITAFAHHQGYIGNECRFIASDGEHVAKVIDNNTISLKMNNVQTIVYHPDGVEIHTGSPHFVINTNDDLNKINVNDLGKKIRNESRFAPEGININFVKIDNNDIVIRTYERGVESETLSCGTGSVAAAIWASLSLPDGSYIKSIRALGGSLKIYLKKEKALFSNIWLEGNAFKVFEGKIEL